MKKTVALAFFLCSALAFSQSFEETFPLAPNLASQPGDEAVFETSSFAARNALWYKETYTLLREYAQERDLEVFRHARLLDEANAKKKCLSGVAAAEGAAIVLLLAVLAVGLLK